MKKQNLWLLAGVLLLLVLPLCLGPAEFAGSDAEAQSQITRMHPEYQPWFAPLWMPPSAEVESLLFALQAALGAGAVGYVIGYFRGKRKAGGSL